MDTAYPSLDHTRLTEQTYKVLKEKILKRDLKPREKISVEDTASQLGVSRTPVVVALQQLANDGLVEIVPRRGTFVTELTAGDVAELFDIRLMIELYAAETILQSDKAGELLERIRGSMATMERAMDDDDYGDYEAFMVGDHDLHLALVQAAGNRRLIRMFLDMNVHIQVARAHYMDNVEKAREAYREHEAIVKAVESGRLDAVKDALRAHIGRVRARMLGILEERGGRI